MSPDFCLSVRLSVTVWFVNCIQMAEDFGKNLSRPGSPIIIVFLPQSAHTQFQREPLQLGAVNKRGWENFAGFRLKSPFFSEMLRDRPMVAMEC